MVYYEDMNREDLEVGMPVIVSGSRTETRDGVVTKIGRAWVHISTGSYKDRKFKIDSQSEENGYGNGGARFRTLEQQAEADRRHEAEGIITRSLLGPFGLMSGLPIELLERLAVVVTDWHQGNDS